jgi:hypothetical protein
VSAHGVGFSKTLHNENTTLSSIRDNRPYSLLVALEKGTLRPNRSVKHRVMV